MKHISRTTQQPKQHSWLFYPVVFFRRASSSNSCLLVYLHVRVSVQVRLESDKAAMLQVEAEAASAAHERDTLRNKLKLLQDQILRGNQAAAKQADVQKVGAADQSAAQKRFKVHSMPVCQLASASRDGSRSY